MAGTADVSLACNEGLGLYIPSFDLVLQHASFLPLCVCVPSWRDDVPRVAEVKMRGEEVGPSHRQQAI
jgi:hypothetical protein